MFKPTKPSTKQSLTVEQHEKMCFVFFLLKRNKIQEKNKIKSRIEKNQKENILKHCAYQTKCKDETKTRKRILRKIVNKKESLRNPMLS